ncbi:MAG: hypothetical protein MUF64_02370 [Polyangiaceae bacterium]|jgi:hypothetical protein|nr:hypothetical protein [Polyangiaceae bacterium]
MQTSEIPAQRDPKALKIMAKSLYRQLRESGYERGDVLSFASELLTQVSSESRGEPGPGAP